MELQYCLFYLSFLFVFSLDSMGSPQISPNSWTAWDLSCFCWSIESGRITHFTWPDFACVVQIYFTLQFIFSSCHASYCQVIHWFLLTSELLRSDWDVCWLICCRKWGVLGLFKGLEAKLLQTVLTAALMFLLYEKIASTTFRVMGVKRTMSSHWPLTGWLLARWCHRNWVYLCYEKKWLVDMCFNFYKWMK